MARKKTDIPVDIDEEAKTAARALDADMPEPETHSYDPKLRLHDTFMNLFEQAVGQMPYATVLINKSNEKLELINLVRFIEQHKDGITIPELNTVISYIATAPFQFVRPLMEIIDNKSRQSILWSPVTE